MPEHYSTGRSLAALRVVPERSSSAAHLCPGDSGNGRPSTHRRPSFAPAARAAVTRRESANRLGIPTEREGLKMRVCRRIAGRSSRVPARREADVEGVNESCVASWFLSEARPGVFADVSRTKRRTADSPPSGTMRDDPHHLSPAKRPRRMTGASGWPRRHMWRVYPGSRGPGRDSCKARAPTCQLDREGARVAPVSGAPQSSCSPHAKTLAIGSGTGRRGGEAWVAGMPADGRGFCFPHFSVQRPGGV
jgi:hypothetical protein